MKKSQSDSNRKPLKKVLKQITLTPVQVKILDYQMDFGSQKMNVRYGLN